MTGDRCSKVSENPFTRDFFMSNKFINPDVIGPISSPADAIRMAESGLCWSVKARDFRDIGKVE
jgi:hypothetical protein